MVGVLNLEGSLRAPSWACLRARFRGVPFPDDLRSQSGFPMSSSSDQQADPSPVLGTAAVQPPPAPAESDTNDNDVERNELKNKITGTCQRYGVTNKNK